MVADKRELLLDLLARDKTGPATRSAAENLEDVGEAAEDAAKATEKLGDESERAEDEVGGLGKTARTTAQRVADLDHQIENVNRELQGMAAAWADANDQAERDSITVSIRKTQRELKQLEKSRGILGKLLPEPAKLAPIVTKVGADAGGSFLDGFSQTLDAAGPVKIGATIGAILAGLSFAPALGAVVSAGILGGVGAGGVIGGLKIASKDARVKAEAKELADFVGDQLGDSAGAFVPAALEGIEELKSSFEEIDDDLRSIFDSSARYVGPLVRGLTGLVEQAIGGVDDAVAAAAPIFDVLERNLPELGGIIGDVLSGLSEHGPAAAVALEQVIHVIEGAVITVGGLLEGLTTVYSGLALSGVLGNEARENWIKYSVEAANASKNSEALAGSQERLGVETETAAEAAEKQKKAITDLNKALRAQVDPLFALLDSQDRVTEAQNKYDEAVKKHGKNSKEARDATRQLAGAALDMNDAASKVAATSDGKLTPAMRKVLEEAKLTKPEIAAIERELGRANAQATRWDGVDAKAKFSADTGAAATRVGNLIAQIARVRSKSITLRVGVVGASAAVRVAQILSGRAEGGPVEAGTPYIVGEKRPEVFVPKVDGHIVPSVGQFARSGGGGAAMGGGGGRLVVDVTGADEDLIRLFRKWIRTRNLLNA